jgi:hypothetical protein
MCGVAFVWPTARLALPAAAGFGDQACPPFNRSLAPSQQPEAEPAATAEASWTEGIDESADAALQRAGLHGASLLLCAAHEPGSSDAAARGPRVSPTLLVEELIACLGRRGPDSTGQTAHPIHGDATFIGRCAPGVRPCRSPGRLSAPAV